MNILIATDSFKGSLRTLEAAEAMKKGILRILPEAHITILPIADGGEGTVETMVSGMGGTMEWYEVFSPTGNLIKAPVGYLGSETAVIEMAAASGLGLIKPCEESIRTATTYGTGQLFLHALDHGCKTIHIGLGGSGTNDGGIGFAQALGYRFCDGTGVWFPDRQISLLDPIAGIDSSHADSRLKQVSVIAISDVDNPLLGEFGAANVFGRQKGMTEELIPVFEKAMERFAELLKQEFGRDLIKEPGAGAGGGFGAGLLSFTKAEIKKGIDAVLDVVDFDKRIADADLVITGEGCLDFQSIRGKVPVGVAQRAKRQGKQVAAVVGSVGKGYEQVFEYGLDAVESSVVYPLTLECALNRAEEFVADAAERLMRAILTGQNIIELPVQAG